MNYFICCCRRLPRRLCVDDARRDVQDDQVRGDLRPLDLADRGCGDADLNRLVRARLRVRDDDDERGCVRQLRGGRVPRRVPLVGRACARRGRSVLRPHVLARRRRHVRLRCDDGRVVCSPLPSVLGARATRDGGCARAGAVRMPGQVSSRFGRPRKNLHGSDTRRRLLTRHAPSLSR